MSKIIKTISLITIVLLCTTVVVASPLDIVRSNKEAWNCVDYSISYSRENPEWGLVVLSTNKFFQGENHLVNYQYDSINDILYIHDEMYGNDFAYSNFI